MIFSVAPDHLKTVGGSNRVSYVFLYVKFLEISGNFRKNHRSRSSDGVRRQIWVLDDVEFSCGSIGNTF